MTFTQMIGRPVISPPTSPPIQSIFITESPKRAPDIDILITDSANKYGVDAEIMRRVIECESGGNPNVIGDNGNSYGLVQISLPHHPEVLKEQALDPEFATEFLAKNLSEGKGSMWTCFRLLGHVN